MSTVQLVNENAILEEVGEILHDIHNRFVQQIDKISELLSQLSRPKLREAKIRFGRLIGGADHIERLAMYGSNNLPKYLAIPYKTIRASTYKGLSKDVKKQIINPNTVIPVQTRTGVAHKRLEELNQLEWEQVLDDCKGLRTPEEQKRQMLKDGEKLSKQEKKAMMKNYIFTKAISAPDDPGCLLLFGEKRGFPEDTITLIVPQKTLRNFIG